MPEYPDLDKNKIEPDTTPDYPSGKDYKGFEDTIEMQKEWTGVNYVMWKNMKEMRRVVEEKLLHDFFDYIHQKESDFLVSSNYFGSSERTQKVIEQFLDERNKK